MVSVSVCLFRHVIDFWGCLHYKWYRTPQEKITCSDKQTLMEMVWTAWDSVHVMILGILNTTMRNLCQHSRHWWNEVSFPSTMITFDWLQIVTRRVGPTLCGHVLRRWTFGMTFYGRWFIVPVGSSCLFWKDQPCHKLVIHAWHVWLVVGNTH